MPAHALTPSSRSRQRWTRWSDVGLALVGGLLLWLAFPHWDLWWLAPVGVGCFAAATRGASLRRGAFLGLVIGCAFFGPVLFWAGTFVGRGIGAALMLFQASYLVLLGVACAWVQRGRTTGWDLGVRPVSVALLWGAQETLRGSWPWGGFPWARLAFSQGDSPLLRWASLVGAPGLSVAVAAVGTLGTVAVLQAIEHHRSDGGWDRGTWRTPHARWSSLAGLGALGLVLLAGAVPVVHDEAGDRVVRVTAIQGNVEVAGLDFNHKARDLLRRHVAETERAMRDLRQSGRRPPDLVLWPENSSDIDPLRDRTSAAAVQQAVRAAGTTVVVGAVLAEPPGHTSNTVLAYPADGRPPVARYTKMHPVPFAEYMPARDFFRHFSSAVDLAGYFVAGEPPNVVTVPTRAGDVRLGVGICFESAYDSLMTGAVRDGAELVYIPTNNATFGRTDEAVQQLAISRVRAVELGRSVVHISNVGISGVVTPDGVVHERTGHFVAASITYDVHLHTQRTPATRWPLHPQWVVAGMGVLVLLLAVLRSRGARARHGGTRTRVPSSA